MQAVMQTLPISDLRFRQAAMLDHLQERPVVLPRQGRAAAVLVAPDEWNAIVCQLEDLEDALAVMQARLEILAGDEELLDWETVKPQLRTTVSRDDLHD